MMATFQRVNVYNRFLPFAHSLDKDADRLWNEVKSDLAACLSSRPLQQARLSGIVVCLHKYIALFGLRFSKAEHVHLITTLYALFTTPDMDPMVLDDLSKVLAILLKKTYLLSRSDLSLQWRPLFDLYYHLEDSSWSVRGMVKATPELKSQLRLVIKYSRTYFSADATAEMLQAWRPMLCPFDLAINMAVRYLELFLPTPISLSPAVSYMLWKDEFMQLWSSFENSPIWEVELFNLFARLAHNHIGRIDWEPHLDFFFTRIMGSLCLPVSYGNSGIQIKFGLSSSGYFPPIAMWIVSAMGGENNSVQKYLDKMLQAIESYYYLANDNPASENLHMFIPVLCTCFIDRVHLERYNKKFECLTPEEKRLTDADIDHFVTSLLPIAGHMLFNHYIHERTVVFNTLATLRPHLIMPNLLEKLTSASECLTEPHRFTACVNALGSCSRPLVENYPHEVIRLLTVILPGIDVNDIWKSTDIFILMSNLLEMIWLVDFSDPGMRMDTADITEEETEFLNQTAMFEDFVLRYTDRCLSLIEHSSREQTRHEVDTHEDCFNDEEIAADAAIFDTFQKIMYRCSPKIFSLAFDKLKRYVTSRILEPCVAGNILASMCKTMVAVQPKVSLDFFVPHLCSRINDILNDRKSATFRQGTQQKADQELQFTLLLLSEVVSVRCLQYAAHPGDSVLSHVDQINRILDRTVHLEQKDESLMAGTVLMNLLTNLVTIRPVQVFKSYTETCWSRETFSWAQAANLDELHTEWYIPGQQELAVVMKLVERYLLPELDSLTNLAAGRLSMEKEEVLRRLRLVYKVVYGCSLLLPPMQIGAVMESHISMTMEPLHRIYLTLQGKHFRHTVRQVLHQVQAYLLTHSPDDTESLNCVITIYELLLLTFGLDEDEVNDHIDDLKVMKANNLNRLVRSKRHLKWVLDDRILLQFEIHVMFKNNVVMETLPLEMVDDIFSLATSHYSEVRSLAQNLLGKVMARLGNLLCHEYLLPKLVGLLKSSPEVSHEQLKGALYLIDLDRFLFFYSWKMAVRLIPALIRADHSDKPSVVELLKDVSCKMNRMFSTYALYTIPIRQPVLAPAAATPVSVDPHFVALESELCQLIRDGNLHWRHTQMALGVMLSLIVKGYVCPPHVVEMWLDCLLNDDLRIRQSAFQALEGVLKNCKTRLKRVQRATEATSLEAAFGVRPDNEWLQYRPNMNDQQLEEYWQQPFLVKPYLGYSSWPEPALSLHVPDELSSIEPEHVSRLILAFFQDADKLGRFIALNSMEHKKGEDFFSMDKGLFYSMMFECFGPKPLVALFLPHLNKAVLSHQESEQRFASELIFGLLRGSRFWHLDSIRQLWQALTPLLKTVLTNMVPETVSDWEICIGSATNKADPNRLRWLFELLVNRESLNLTQGAFQESSLLRLLNKSLVQNWKLRELYNQTYELLKEYWDHPYNKVRRQISSMMATLCSMDVDHASQGRPSTNLGQGFPTKSAFIQQIIPKLNLYFHNPELNGLVKQNGTMDDPINLNFNHPDSSNSSSMDVDAAEEVLAAKNARKNSSTVLLEMVALWVGQFIQQSSASMTCEVYNLLPFFCQFVGNEAHQEASQSCLKALCYLSACIVPRHVIPAALDMCWKVMQSPSWKAKISILEFVQVFVFTNFMSICMRPELVKKTEELVVGLMADDSLQVRLAAAKMLGGLVHSRFLDSQAQRRLLQYFRAKIRSIMKRGGSKNKFHRCVAVMDSKSQLTNYHAGILGLCAFVEAFPYDVPDFVPDILIELEKHLHDPQPIPKTIKKTFQEFKRTHTDNWSEHKLKFTEDQLEVMTDILVSHNYYA